MSGRLQGRVLDAGGSACFWIGDAGGGTPLVWPAAHWASDAPLTVHDGDGTELARAGQLVSLGGGFASAGDGVATLGCPAGERRWVVTEVQAAVEDLPAIPYERCAGPARAVLRQAEREARSAGHLYLGTEHVLLALIGDRAGAAGRVLAVLGVRQDSARRRIGEVVRVRPDPPSTPRAGLVITEQVRVLLGLALQQAAAAGRAAVATEDLLLALSMGRGSIGPVVLREWDVTPERVREQIRREGT